MQLLIILNGRMVEHNVLQAVGVVTTESALSFRSTFETCSYWAVQADVTSTLIRYVQQVTHRYRHKETDTYTHRLTDIHTHSHRQTDRQTDSQIQTHKDT